jgi:enoyl-CoA hydratase/carnithine racemase
VPEGSAILFEADGHVARITINRPERMNAFEPDTHVELSAALDRFEADDDLWVAVLTGVGTRSFCAGRDLKQLAESNARGKDGAAEDAAKVAQVRRSPTASTSPSRSSPGSTATRWTVASSSRWPAT